MLKPANYLRLMLLAGASAACLASVAAAQDTTAQDTSVNEDEADDTLRQQSVVVRGQFIPDEKRSTSEVSSLIDAGDFQVTGDADAAAAILAEHMAEAEQHMLGLQAKLVDRFLSEESAPRRTRRRRVP